jgi:hypothetical protein
MTQDDEKLGSAENVCHRSLAEDMDDTVHVTQLLGEAKPKLWTKRMFRLYGILLLGYLCIVLQGYDGSLMGAINAMVRINAFVALMSKVFLTDY